LKLNLNLQFATVTVVITKQVALLSLSQTGHVMLHVCS